MCDKNSLMFKNGLTFFLLVNSFAFCEKQSATNFFSKRLDDNYDLKKKEREREQNRIQRYLPQLMDST